MGCASSSTASNEAKKVPSSKPSSETIRQRRKEQMYKTGSLSQNLVHQEHGPTAVLKERYEVVRQLGVGSMGTVAAVRVKPRQPSTVQQQSQASAISSATDGRLFALKTIRGNRISREFLKELQNEIESIRRMDHPNVVKFHEVLYFPPKGIAILMDFLSGGDLHARKPYTEVQAAAIMKQVLRALNYIHGQNFVHLDIKFENIMFVNKEPTSPVKIIDFGFAQRLDPTDTKEVQHKQLGTFDTMSPEVFSGNYTTKADLWSAGVVAYELICGNKPFTAMSPMGVIAKIAKGTYTLTDYSWKEKSVEAKQFFERFDVDGTGVITVQEFKKALRAMGGTTGCDQNEFGECYQCMDTYGNGVVAYTEFLAALLERHMNITEDRIADAFEHIDISNTGSITKEDLRLLLGKDFSDDYANEIINQMDLDHSGQISFEEFLTAFRANQVGLGQMTKGWSTGRVFDLFRLHHQFYEREDPKRKACAHTGFMAL
eukprot:scaffold2782_cov182-Amphora_coffeaeformis.AAC.9